MAERKALMGKAQHLDPSSEAWRTLPWRKLEQYVYRIQKRIYRARQHGKTRTAQKLQKLLMKSEAARLLAVRRVTQDNQGKKTAGIDGVKAVKPGQRLAMAKQVHPKHWKRHKPKPVRRVWIPKPGKAEQRPLGIPTMQERAKQALVKIALEPEWEAVFEPNSYGFRPARSCHDAIAAIFLAIRYKPKFVYDADIKGCFDNINQEALLKKLGTYSALRQTVKGWLKAGVMEGVTFSPTELGTPQGGVISPLLANIALHGMEEAVSDGYTRNEEKPLMVRYADDFVIFHSNLEELQKVAQVVTEWLEGMGLHLNARKTRVTHTLTPHEGNVGFDFLGFHVRQCHEGKTHTGKDTHGRPLGFKTIIKPSKEAIKRHTTATKERIKKLRSAPQGALVTQLNPIIWGWSNYYRTVVSSKVFTKCDYILWIQLERWCKSRHPNKGRSWRKRKYWQHVDGAKVFATPEGARMRWHRWTNIQRHTKVKGTASPYDGDLLYWNKRLKHHPMMHTEKAKLLQKQIGRCLKCGLLFRDEDVMETDHIDRNRSNNRLSNKRLLHRHCHDEIHANDQPEAKSSRKPKDANPNRPMEEEIETEELEKLYRRDAERMRQLNIEGIKIK